MIASLSQFPDASRAITLNQSERVFRSPVGTQPGTAFTTASGTLYSVYIGRVAVTCIPAFIAALLRTAGTGAQTAEMGWSTSPTAPSKAGQVLTCRAATGTITTLASGAPSVVRNTGAFTTPALAGWHVWAQMREAMASTRPALNSLIYDWGEGYILSTAAAGVLTVGTAYTGALIAIGTTAIAPDLRMELD